MSLIFPSIPPAPLKKISKRAQLLVVGPAALSLSLSDGGQDQPKVPSSLKLTNSL